MNPEIHPDNKGFSWSVPKGPYQYLSDEEVKQFDKKGYLTIENAFDSKFMQHIVSLIDPFETITPANTPFRNYNYRYKRKEGGKHE